MIGQGHGSGTGTIAASAVDVVSPTEITAVTGGGATPGAFTLYVISPSNQISAAVKANNTFTYQPVPAPAVAAVSPNTGPTSGGTTVTITGTGFVSGDQVVIGQGHGSGTGTIAASAVDVVSPTEITAVTGGGATPGAFTLYVISPSNQISAAVKANNTFTYQPVPAPAVAAVSPNTGPTSGGTTVTITGTGFVSGDQVVIGQGHGSGTGTIAASAVDVVSPTEITAVTGGGATPGAFTLYVISPSNQISAAVKANNTFTYQPVPNSYPA